MSNPVPFTRQKPYPAAGLYLLIVCYFLTFLFIACNNAPEKEPRPSAADSAAAAKRQQVIADSIARVSANKKKIYLTFDDGPNMGTRNVLAAAQKENTPVSFFIVGLHAHDGTWQREAVKLIREDKRMELCNHSYTHGLRNRYNTFYNSPSTVVADFIRSDDSLHFPNAIARMPGRNAWRIDSIIYTDIKESRVAVDSLHNAGFAIMGWDLEWMYSHKTFSVKTDPDLLLRQIENMLEAGKTKIPGHLVLLAHDQAFQKEEDIAKLHYFLQQLKANPDYELKLASHYPGAAKYFFPKP